MKINKLFYVEFGEPNQGNVFSFGGSSSVKAIYVVANDYKQASDKAGAYLENYLATNPEVKSILDSDGSLKNTTHSGNQKQPDPQIISVKLLSDEIIY